MSGLERLQAAEDLNQLDLLSRLERKDAEFKTSFWGNWNDISTSQKWARGFFAVLNIFFGAAAITIAVKRSNHLKAMSSLQDLQQAQKHSAPRKPSVKDELPVKNQQTGKVLKESGSYSFGAGNRRHLSKSLEAGLQEDTMSTYDKDVARSTYAIGSESPMSNSRGDNPKEMDSKIDSYIRQGLPTMDKTKEDEAAILVKKLMHQGSQALFYKASNGARGSNFLLPSGSDSSYRLVQGGEKGVFYLETTMDLKGGNNVIRATPGVQDVVGPFDTSDDIPDHQRLNYNIDAEFTVLVRIDVSNPDDPKVDTLSASGSYEIDRNGYWMDSENFTSEDWVSLDNLESAKTTALPKLKEVLLSDSGSTYEFDDETDRDVRVLVENRLLTPEVLDGLQSGNLETAKDLHAALVREKELLSLRFRTKKERNTVHLIDAHRRSQGLEPLDREQLQKIESKSFFRMEVIEKEFPSKSLGEYSLKQELENRFPEYNPETSGMSVAEILRNHSDNIEMTNFILSLGVED